MKIIAIGIGFRSIKYLGRRASWDTNLILQIMIGECWVEDLDINNDCLQCNMNFLSLFGVFLTWNSSSRHDLDRDFESAKEMYRELLNQNTENALPIANLIGQKLLWTPSNATLI